jgi:hypothetical protein
MNWKISLENMAKGQFPCGRKLRHNLSRVSVSDLSTQRYCELKVDNKYLRRETVAIPSKRKGLELHDTILPSPTQSLEQIVNGIESLEVFVTFFPLVGKYKDVVIAGRPDATIFVHGRPKFLVELKTTYGNSLTIWRNDVVQTGIYALLLEQMGFDCSSLQLAVLRLRQDPSESLIHKSRFVYSIASVLVNARIKDLERIYLDNIRCECVSYNRHEVESELNWALGYWLSEREPERTSAAVRCNSCEYLKTCNS